jgi:hypothetical protein
MGGADKYEQHLDQLFTAENKPLDAITILLER